MSTNADNPVPSSAAATLAGATNLLGLLLGLLLLPPPGAQGHACLTA